MEIVFIGTGSSTATPAPICAADPAHRCSVCSDALKLGPLESHNWRSNPSVVIKLPNTRHAYGCSNILIDCGKTFHEAMLRWFPRREIRTVDAVVLTHEHADAIFGLDDLRGLQPYSLKSKPVEGQNVDYMGGFDAIAPLPVHLNEHTFKTVQRAFPYLIQPPGKSSKVWRRVAKIAFEVFHETSDFHPVDSLPCTFTPLPVEHGSDYISMGFLIKYSPPPASGGAEGTRSLAQVVYISDVSKIPEETFDIIHSAAASAPINLLVLDTLSGEDKVHQTHFNIAEAVKAANAIRPQRCLLVGMSHAIDHDEGNAWLKARNLEFPMELAYDGLVVSIPDDEEEDEES